MQHMHTHKEDHIADTILHAVAIITTDLEPMLIQYHCHIHSGLYPNVNLQGTGIPEVTQQSNSFIYLWPREEQEACPGIVTSLEYCFEMSGINNTQATPVFTLRLLEAAAADGTSYRVIQTINVMTSDTSSVCDPEALRPTCCSRMQLSAKEQFQIPSTIAAFEISTSRQVGGILAYRVGQERSVMGFQINTNRIETNGVIRVDREEKTTISYRMFNFVIGKFLLYHHI